MTILSLREKLGTDYKSDKELEGSSDSNIFASFQDRVSGMEKEYSQAFEELEAKHKGDIWLKDQEIQKVRLYK
jgi:hypothetical protein